MAKAPSILIVDDEINVTRTLQLVFQEAGYEVKTAYSSAEAIKLLSKGGHFDAVITDLNMEKEDIGLEVARKAKLLAPRAGHRDLHGICERQELAPGARDARGLSGDETGGPG